MTKRMRTESDARGWARGAGWCAVATVVLAIVSGQALAQGNNGGPDNGAPTCGPATPGSKPPNLRDLAWCNAILIVSHKKNGKPDASQLTEPDTLIFLALSQGLKSESDSKLELQLVTTQNETKRTDKQIGASANAEGSTTVAEKTGFADLLGIAVENGTIQQEVNGTTLTLSSSPYSLTAWAHGDTAQNYQAHENDLARVGVSATFNISNQQDVLSNATRKQLAEWSVKVRLNRDHSTRSKAFEKWWQDNAASKVAEEDVVLTAELAKSFKGGPAEAQALIVRNKFFNINNPPNAAPIGSGFIQTYLDAHASDGDEQLIIGLRDEIMARLKQEVTDQVAAFGLSDDDKKRIVTVVTTSLPRAHALVVEALQAVNAQIDALNGKPSLTLVYTNVRDALTSDYSVVKFLLEKSTSNSAKLVFNAGSSFYSNPDKTKNQQTVRDYATALSWESRLGRSPLVLNDADQGQMTLSFAGRYQRLLENRHQPDKKADLAVVQVKFEIPVFSGVTFPLSISYATASELLKEDHVHANFGFSFDTDKLYQLLAFKKKAAAVQ